MVSDKPGKICYNINTQQGNYNNRIQFGDVVASTGIVEHK